MARPSPDYLLGKIIHGFLGSVASRAAGVPAEADVPLVLMDDGMPERLPALVVKGAEDKSSKTACKRVVDVTCFLFYMVQVTGPDAPTDDESLKQVMTREAAAVMADKVESRLRNKAAFATYLATLTTDERTGWGILKYHPMPAEEMRREKNDGQMTVAINVRITLAWSESI